jgi:hypothetical protein
MGYLSSGSISEIEDAVIAEMRLRVDEREVPSSERGGESKFSKSSDGIGDGKFSERSGFGVLSCS